MNVQRLNQIIQIVEKNPERLNQMDWHTERTRLKWFPHPCGTAHCVAGWAQMIMHGRQDGKLKMAGLNTVAREEVLKLDLGSARQEGMEWLELDEDQAMYLFSTQRSLDEIKAFAASGGVVPRPRFVGEM